VQYVSEKIRQQVIEIISVTEDVVEINTQILEDVLPVDPRDLERTGRACQNWLTRYGVELVENLHAPANICIREILSLVKSKTGEWAPEVVHWGRLHGRIQAEIRQTSAMLLSSSIVSKEIGRHSR